MAGELKYVTFNTDMGWVGILASAGGLLATTLPQTSAEEARQLLGSRVNQATWSPPSFADLMELLKVYFTGQEVTFPHELDLSEYTPFQRDVWQMTRSIPYGETRSYLWVAIEINRPQAARAVGQALGRNPLPIIVPCHRVVASNGGLCGFTGGLDTKRELLNMESSSLGLQG